MRTTAHAGGAKEWGLAVAIKDILDADCSAMMPSGGSEYWLDKAVHMPCMTWGVELLVHPVGLRTIGE